MALAFKRFVTVRVAAAATSYYTASGVDAQLDAVTLSNVHTAAVTVSLWTPSGGGPSDGDLILKDESVAAGASVTVPSLRGHVIQDGMQLWAVASIANVVTLVVSGRTKTV